MAPSPQEPVVADKDPMERPMSRPLTGKEVVISGMSGIFPKSDSTLEFMENLYNKVDMVSKHDRWDYSHPEVPKNLGIVNGMGKFDAQFFRVHFKQACTMEPMSRKLLEHAYSAIYDSGINPLQLRGSKVGVFIGSAFSESEKNVIYEHIQRNGFGITGCNKAMYANRISYWIDGKGPSYALDIACASSMGCLEHAYRSISTGQCDAAIVGGCNLCTHPNVSLNMKRAGFLCLDGKTKAFDNNGDGYVRSDAISVLFLQKAKDARRIYSEVYSAKGEYSSQPNTEFLPIRETRDIQQFLEQFYSEINVSPSEVEYVEANGSGIAEADGKELEAIGKVFGKEKPIKVGSVKSNMGHAEPASGTCAVTKVCLAYHKGKLPANLHYSEPQNHISAVREGKVKVLQEHAPFNRGFAALSSFSYSGANIHVLLKGCYKPKDPERYKSSIPYLVNISGRQESCVKNVIDKLEKQPIDPEQIGLLHSIHQSEIQGHLCRGYTILDTDKQNNTSCLSRNVDFYPETKEPIWFMYSGMGSQWAGMGADLMRIPVFASAIQRCHKALEPRGIDIVRILTEPDKKVYDNIVNSFVGIAAVQIGLTDIFKELGIIPDNIIGHSVGELGCAYADGCCTAEEMILSAYSRGAVSCQVPLIRGSMAAVGLGYNAILDLCPPEIEVACHNSYESSTISGPADIMKEFVAELTQKGIFAKEVPCSNIAYHSRYIADAGPGLLKYLRGIITDPKPRSEKWVSTSVPQDKWDQPMAKFSSAEYHTNNLLSPVLFEETSRLIPNNAIVIEIAPHGLLQAIVKRSHTSCTHIPLTKRGHTSPVQFLLEAIGKLYQKGFNPKVEALYPKIEFPVSTGTPFLSQLVEWEHSETWPQAHYNTKERIASKARDFVISIHDDDYKYLEGHRRGGVLVFPEAAQLVLVWETLAMHHGCNYKDMSVVFSDVRFHNEAQIKTEEPFKLWIMIHKGSNEFEVSHNRVKIATGTVMELHGERAIAVGNFKDDEVLLTSNDIYKIMHLKGYSYTGEFQSIVTSNTNRNMGHVKWTNEWVTFLDSLIQLNILSRDYIGTCKVIHIKQLTINIVNHKNDTTNLNNKVPYLIAEVNNILDVTRCAGVQISQLGFCDKPILNQDPDILLTKSFVPHFLIGEFDIDIALFISLQIIADNTRDSQIKLTEIVTNSTPTSNRIKTVVNRIPGATFDVKTIDTSTVALKALEIMRKTDVFVVHNLLENETKKNNLYNVISKDAFVLTFEDNAIKNNQKFKLFNVISAMTVQRKNLVLLNKSDNIERENIRYLPITQDNTFSWIPRVQSELEKNGRLVLVSENQSYCGLLGLVKKLNKDSDKMVGVVIIDDVEAPSFDPDNNIYKDQLQRNLNINILKKGQWGGNYYLPSAISATIHNFQLIINAPGDIDSLTWNETPSVSTSNTLVKVCYAGPSLRDAQKAVGKVKSDKNIIGMDFAGLNEKEEKVMGLIPGGAISSIVEADPDFLWPVPDHWSLEDAATVPLPYIHAYYCLGVRHPLMRGQTVFVSGGAGAFGQAVISICLALDCPVYTIVSDVQKKLFLLNLFPKLNENNIGCSWDDSFYNNVISNTMGKGCNLVISCLSGPMRKSAMKCVGFSGIFIDINDYDMRNNEDFGMFYLMKERNYLSFHLSNVFKPENIEDRKTLQLLIANGIAKDIIRPLSRVVYSPNDVSKAFRLLCLSKHRGRVLIRMRDPVTLSQKMKVNPRVNFSSTGTHVIVSNENNVGTEFIEYLITNGARKLIVHVNPNNTDGYFHTKLVSWRKQKVSLKLTSVNLQTKQGCINILEDGTKLGPIESIFIVLSSTPDASQDLSQKIFISNFNQKAQVIANLDSISRNICGTLRHFVVLTTTSNSLVDEYVLSVSKKICQARNEVGLPAIAFQIEDSSINGLNMRQRMTTAFHSLDASLKLKYDDVISLPLNKKSDIDIFQKIASIFGANNIEEIPEDLQLSNLNLNDIIVEEVKAVLKHTFDTAYTSETVQNMSIANIKELMYNMKQKSKAVSGLGAFYTFIDNDECMATEPMKVMATKLSNAVEEEEELDPNSDYLMLIPGFQGHHQIFTTICERVKIQAMTLQLGPDITDKSIPEIASDILKFMKKRFVLKSKFYFLGYSFGVNVALQLAALMEKEGYVGVVYCLDSSPDALRIQLETHLGNISDTQLQNTIIEHMYSLMAGENNDNLKDDLNKLENWSDKIDTCVSRLKGIASNSIQYKRLILKSAYERIKLAKEYEPDFKLNSEIILMKGIPHTVAETLSEDYNLSKYTKQPVRVFNLGSDHVSSPFDCRVSNIVNRCLDPNIIDEFRKQSLCETYICDSSRLF